MAVVPFFDYPAVYRSNEDRYRDVIADVLERGAFILQRDLVEFEQALAAYCGVAHGIGTGNCTDALAIALSALGIGRGDEVVLPSHTFVASAGAIVECGAEPVFVDIGVDHLIDTDAVRAAIGPRTAAIMPVSLNGRCADLPAIVELAAAHGLAVIEDAAQALGATIDGTAAGSFGNAGAFSFYPAKNLGCFGDGGAIVTDDDGLAHHCLLRRDHGRNHDTGEVEMWGVNSRLDNLQAAVLSRNLIDYPAMISRRREIAAAYDRALSGVGDLVLPPGPDADDRRFDTYQNYEIESSSRDELARHLADRRIGTSLPWGGKPVHRFERLGVVADLPVTDRLFERVLLLPMNHFLDDDQVDHVVGAVRSFFGG